MKVTIEAVNRYLAAMQAAAETLSHYPEVVAETMDAVQRAVDAANNSAPSDDPADAA